MIRSRMTSERLASLFLLGVLLFNPPLLSIFDFPDYVLGIPVLYIYLFTAWAVLVLLMALTIESAAAVEEAEEPAPAADSGGDPPGDEGAR
ncbi:MAG: hypothetical protein V3V34_10515 [Kiloniellales bacterium]